MMPLDRPNKNPPTTKNLKLKKKDYFFMSRFKKRKIDELFDKWKKITCRNADVSIEQT